MSGWEVEPDPLVTVSRTKSGEFTIPVDVLLDRRHVARRDLALTGDQIERIYAGMWAHVAARFPMNGAGDRHEGPDR